MIVVAILACLALLSWVYLALFHGHFWRPLLDRPAPEPSSWPSVDIIVPARNEATVLPHALPSLLKQNYPGTWRILLIDDHSTDGTGSTALQRAADLKETDRLRVVSAPDLPEGWSGKIAAMQAGVFQSTSDYILFTDADIEHPSDSLRCLVARALADKLDLVSLMVKLHCESEAEKLLIPSFVFFFSLLYPFFRVNDPDSRTAAAAGGVMLVKKKALVNGGGLTRIKGALIDDCAFARLIKDNGGDWSTKGKIRLTLTKDVISLRHYPTFADVEKMIARTAFTQLRTSFFLLLGTVVGLGLLFLMPLIGFTTGGPLAVEAGIAAWLIMSYLYTPMIRFYGLPYVWALTLPFAAFVYIAATIDSAWQYWQGKGGHWKGRAQAS